MARKHLSPLNLVNLTADPGTATEGDFYWNSSTNKLRVYYDGAWADATQAASVYQFSATAPSSPTAGDYWIDSTTGSGYVYVSDGDSSQWVDLESNGYIGSSISLTSSNPVALGSVAVGTASDAARADHVHPTTGLVTTSSLGSGVSTALGLATGVTGAFVVNGGALGTPSSGNLSNATSLPISGLTASTTAALGVGSVELGHASDTTISRVSAGRISVEGVNVPTISSTDTLTNKTITALVLSAGTASANTAPIKLTSGTNLTAIEAGAIEFDGTVATLTPNTNYGRAPIATPIMTSGAGTSGITLTTNYALFPTAADTITLPIGTYFWQTSFRVIVTGSTVGSTLSFSPLGAGTAAGTFSWNGLGVAGSGNFTQSTPTMYSNAQQQTIANATTIAPSSATNPRTYFVTGTAIVRITTAGTVIPAYQFAATLTGGTVTFGADNHLIITPLSSSGSTVSTGAWA